MHKKALLVAILSITNSTESCAVSRRRVKTPTTHYSQTQVELAERLRKAQQEVDFAQEDIDRAIALSLQDQDERELRNEAQSRAEKRALERTAREIKQASEQLRRTMALHPVPVATPWVDKGFIEQVPVVQQQGTECGYWAAIDATILYHALTVGLPDVVMPDAKIFLLDEKRMRAELARAQDTLANVERFEMCRFALDEGGIADIMQHYAHINPENYSMFSTLLPENVHDLSSFQEPIVDTIRSIKSTPGKTHIFFLRQGAARTIGHWIAVVVTNTGDHLACYVIDSLKGNPAHDTMWKRLVGLIQQVGRVS